MKAQLRERFDTGYAAARFYGFAKTAEAIGAVPVTTESMARCMKKHWSAVCAAALYNDASQSPFLALVPR